MAKIVTVSLPHDLPENWNESQYVSPGGVEVGLTEQHGFNYLMRQVNNTQRAVEELDEAMSESSGNGGSSEPIPTISATTESKFETEMSTIVSNMSDYTSKKVIATLGFLGDSADFECIITRRAAYNVLIRMYSLQTGIAMAQKLRSNVGWLALEWINPPLVEGTEYRTVERIGGKIVFKKLVNGILQYHLYGETEWKPYRNVVGAAPSGYYTDVTTVTSESALEQALKTKAYGLEAYKSTDFIVNVTVDSLSLPMGTWYVEVTKQSSELSMFTLRCPNGQGMLIAIRHLVSAALRGCEWVNPPFVPDVEYRTIERIDSKTVFKKNISGVINYRLDGESKYKPYAQAIGAALGTTVTSASVE